jgi:hypothetical protein
MNDLISRQDAQERQRVAQKRRYTFGNDEFSLEAAYHDCKLVFDGITDDDSFQEADTGLILYYANEIIYALHEALKGKGTNVHSNDYISRQQAIDALWKALYEYEDKTEKQFIDSEELDVADWIQHRNFVQNMSDIDRQTILSLPSAQPEPLTDKEQRIFLAAMGREEKVCKQVDEECRDCREAYEDSLVKTCHEIIRKVKGALWT